MAADRALIEHLRTLQSCNRCPQMIGPVVVGQPVRSPILLVGQAPGPREGQFGRPFAWTAGKQLFKWFGQLGLEEADFRSRVYMAAVCRCFPGKKASGGDREPSPDEIANCAGWLDREIQLNRPQLVIPVGRIAIEQILGKAPLADVIGKQHHAARAGHAFDLIPLPHPSGASTWFKMEPGRTLTQKALRLIKRHAAWRAVTSTSR